MAIYNGVEIMDLVVYPIMISGEHEKELFGYYTNRGTGISRSVGKGFGGSNGYNDETITVKQIEYDGTTVYVFPDNYETGEVITESLSPKEEEKIEKKMQRKAFKKLTVAEIDAFGLTDLYNSL